MDRSHILKPFQLQLLDLVSDLNKSEADPSQAQSIRTQKALGLQLGVACGSRNCVGPFFGGKFHEISPPKIERCCIMIQ